MNKNRLKNHGNVFFNDQSWKEGLNSTVKLGKQVVIGRQVRRQLSK